MSTLSLTVPSTVTLVGGRASVAARVTNGSSAEVRVALVAVGPPGGVRGAQAWTSIAEPLREIAAGASDEFTLTFAPPPDVAGGDHVVRVIAYPADEVPEEYADQAGEIHVSVPAGAVPPPPPKRSWWPYLVAAALVVVAVVVAVLIGSKGPPEPRPTVSPSNSASPPASPTPSPIPMPRFDAAALHVQGTVFLNDKEDWPFKDENRTVTVNKTVNLAAGATGNFTWGACVGDEVQGYLDLNLSLDRATGRVTASGLARYYEGTRCGATNLRGKQAVSLAVNPDASEKYLGSLRDGNGAVMFNLVISNVPVPQSGP